jgi:hypothetical protein
MTQPDLPRNPKAKGRPPAKSPATSARATAGKAKKSALIVTPSPAVSPSKDLRELITKRAYELYVERGYRHGFATEDWLDAEREILSQVPPT